MVIEQVVPPCSLTMWHKDTPKPFILSAQSLSVLMKQCSFAHISLNPDYIITVRITLQRDHSLSVQVDLANSLDTRQ